MLTRLTGARVYDPANGVPPMPGFEGMLNDDEVAGVLTYVRTRFGAWGSSGVTTPETVARIRRDVASKEGFYTVEELLKEHPFPAPTSTNDKPLVYGQEKTGTR